MDTNCTKCGAKLEEYHAQDTMAPPPPLPIQIAPTAQASPSTPSPPPFVPDFAPSSKNNNNNSAPVLQTPIENNNNNNSAPALQVPNVNLRSQLYAQVSALNETIDKIIAERCSELEKQIEQEREVMRSTQERLIGSVYSQEKVMSFPSVIELDVGGVFDTAPLFVLRKMPGTLLDLLFSGEYKMAPDPRTNRYFIDRNGELFKYILDFLRDGNVVLPSAEEGGSKRDRILAEARFYGINLSPDVDNEEEWAESSSESLPLELFRPQWSLDPAVKNSLLVLEENNFTVSHTGSSS